jgi:Amt family ammonium transporter
METEVESVKSFVDTLWVIDCAILVFIMQAGFMCVESGLSRHKNSINVEYLLLYFGYLALG